LIPEGHSKEDIVDGIAETMMEQTPALFDLDMMEERFPTSYQESTNTVAKQESFKYNRLLRVMKGILPQLRKALKGLVAMSEELGDVNNALFLNQVPEVFSKSGFLSLMNLTFWMRDLIARCDFIQNWIDVLVPPCMWLSGLFFPQAYFTG
jgi:dynein heavy chain, axonemal